MEKNLTYYQPIAYHDDGTNIEYGNLPEELASFMVFPTREDCEEWLDDNGYDPEDYAIIEYHDDDIEEPTFVGADGNYIDGTGSVGCYNTEKCLDEGYDRLITEIEEAQRRTGKNLIEIDPVTLYEDAGTLGGDWRDKRSLERPTIVSIDKTSAYSVDGESFSLENITDYDDYMMLMDAVCFVMPESLT